MRLTRRLSRRLSHRLSHGDEGFTLTELLIVIAMIGIIVAPLTAVLIVVLQNTGSTTERLSETVDGEFVTAYFIQDVQSIGVRDWSISPAYPHKASIELNKAASGGTYHCGTGSETAVFRFAWENPLGSTAPTEPRVSYVVRNVGAERQLHRVACDGDDNPNTHNDEDDVTSDIILAHNLDKTTANPVVVVCKGPTGAVVPCETVPVPITVTLTVTLKGPTSPTPYTLTIVGQRRQQ